MNGVPQETESWPNLEGWVRLAQRDGNVAEALRIITSRELNPVNLYKLYEIVRDDVGNESAMIQRNWATRNQLSAFRRSMNHPAASGAGARHARMEEDPPTDPMSEDQARAFVRGLLRAWLTAKGHSPYQPNYGVGAGSTNRDATFPIVRMVVAWPKLEATPAGYVKFNWSMTRPGAAPQYCTIAGALSIVSVQGLVVSFASSGAGAPSCNAFCFDPNPLPHSVQTAPARTVPPRHDRMAVWSGSAKAEGAAAASTIMAPLLATAPRVT